MQIKLWLEFNSLVRDSLSEDFIPHSSGSLGILNHPSKSDLHNFQMQYENKTAATYIKILLVKPNHISTVITPRPE